MALQGTVRAAAKDIGAEAIQQAAVTEQTENELVQQRKSNRTPLANKDDLRAAAAAIANGWLLPQGTNELPDHHYWHLPL